MKATKYLLLIEKVVMGCEPTIYMHVHLYVYMCKCVTHNFLEHLVELTNKRI